MDSIQDAGTSATRTTGVGVLDRCVTLLDLLAGGPRSLRWLAEASNLPRPTAHRLLVALEAHRLVARDPGAGATAAAFRLGPRLTELAAVAGPELDLASLAGPVLDRLHSATGESVQLYVRSGDHRLCIAARDAGTGLRDSVPVGALLPLEVGSGGKVLLAWSAGTAVGAAGAGRTAGASSAGEPATADGPGSTDRGNGADRFSGPDQARGAAASLAELAAVRSRGWAASVAEREAGVASVSAPVLRDGVLLAALCVSGPVSRLGQAPGRKLAAAVVEAAADLTRQLAALHDPGELCMREPCITLHDLRYRARRRRRRAADAGATSCGATGSGATGSAATGSGAADALPARSPATAFPATGSPAPDTPATDKIASAIADGRVTMSRCAPGSRATGQLLAAAFEACSAYASLSRT